MSRVADELGGGNLGKLVEPGDRVVRGHERRLGVVRVLSRRGKNLNVHDIAQVVVVDGVHELAEHLESLALPGHERVSLRDAAEVDALVQVVHLHEVLAPPLVDDLDQDAAAR